MWGVGRVDSGPMRIPGGTLVGRESSLGILTLNLHRMMGEISIYEVGGVGIRVTHPCTLIRGTPDSGDM